MKVKFSFNTEFLCYLAPFHTLYFQSILRGIGIDVVEEGHDVEFVECEILNRRAGWVTDGDTIVFDRCETSIVTPNALKYQDNPKVLGYVIPMQHRDWDAAIWYRGCPMYDPPTKPVEYVTTLLWDEEIGYPRYAEQMEQHWEKTYRASFVGKISYPMFKYPETYRRMLLANWNRIKGLSVGMFTASQGHHLTESAHWAILSSSKVVVCPWGGAELCMRDYLACFARCMIVTPAQQIDVTCTPWLPDNTVWCQPDYSDLPGAIDEAESLWDYDKLEAIRQKMMAEALSFETLAEKLATALKSIVYGRTS